jgi:hypothetical protein
MDLNITLTKQRTSLPEVLAAVLFSVCSEKALMVMDQTLGVRSQHELVNSFCQEL